MNCPCCTAKLYTKNDPGFTWLHACIYCGFEAKPTMAVLPRTRPVQTISSMPDDMVTITIPRNLLNSLREFVRIANAQDERSLTYSANAVYGMAG